MLPPYNISAPLFYIADQPADRYESLIKMAAIWELPVLGTGSGEAFSVDLSQARDLIFTDRGHEEGY
jgi:hypothetical protein